MATVTGATPSSFRLFMRHRLAVLAAAALLLSAPTRAFGQYSENFNSGVPAGWTGFGIYGTWNGALYLDGTSALYSPFFTMGAPGTRKKRVSASQ